MVEYFKEVNMTRTEMLDFIRNNPNTKITHGLFEPYEFLYMGNDGNVYDENDYLFENFLFGCHNGLQIRCGGDWENGWEVYR